MYTYGLLKTPILAPNNQAAVGSVYLDQIADIKFQVNSWSPEELLPLLSPQIYKVSDFNISESDLPTVSKSTF
jgi:hypothetical protein